MDSVTSSFAAWRRQQVVEQAQSVVMADEIDIAGIKELALQLGKALDHLRALVQRECECEDCCNYCGANLFLGPLESRGKHEPDCPYASAKAFLAKLDATSIIKA